MVEKHLNPAFGIVDSCLFSDVTKRNTVIAFIRRKVYIPHLLDLRSFIVLKFIGISRQRFEILSLYKLEKFNTAGFFSLEQKIVVTLQQDSNFPVEVLQ